MTYYRDTIRAFNIWHDMVKIQEGLPKMGFVKGQLAPPQNQQTTNYVDPVKNPDGSDDCYWLYGKYPIQNQKDLSNDDIAALNWFLKDSI